MSQQWLAFAAVGVAGLSLIVTVIVLIRNSAIETGAIGAKLRAVGEKIKELRDELLGRIRRVESDQVTSNALHREDVQRVFDRITESERKNEVQHSVILSNVNDQHARVGGRLTMLQAGLMALMAVNDKIDAETITRITNGGGFPD